jgi:prepilin-type N-terminal cleavage/methylation domain-containing protein/prepilin-type processing-associated H-X9-DG protein
MCLRRLKGFTLVELLVVIGVIALLISLLLPSLNKARAAAQDIRCKSNLHQVSIVLQMYITDNKGRLPYGGTWSFGANPVGDSFQAALSRYTCPNYDDPYVPWEQKNNCVSGPKGLMPRGIWTCPSLFDPDSLAAAGNHAVYAANGNFMISKYYIWDTSIVYPQVLVTQILQSSKKVGFVEYNMNSQDNTIVTFSANPTLSTPISTADDVDARWNQFGSDNNYLRYRHNNHANAVFMDGHTEGLAKGSVTPAMFVITP